MTSSYYFPIDLLGFHRPRPQLPEYVSQIPILKQESRRSVHGCKGHFVSSSITGQMHSYSRKLHAKETRR